MDFSSAFRGRRILITGNTGFKGSWLALWLQELGAEITGLALPPEGNRSHYALLGLDRTVRHIDGDIRDFAAVQKAFSVGRPEFVFHLAAQALVRRAHNNPKHTFDTNIGGILNVLEAAREAPNLRAMVCITSDKCYVNKEWVWGYRENDELGGDDPYSASKAAAEIVFNAYRRSYFVSNERLGVASTRAGNVIGGGDWAENRIVPDCIRSLEKDEAIELRHPEATRPWQHVLEPLSGYLMLAARLAENPNRYSGSWNFGPLVESVCTVGDLAQKIVSHWGRGNVTFHTRPNETIEHRLLQLNIDKARLDLGWHPRWGVERAIEESVRWYREVLGGAKARDISLAQIKAFEADAASDPAALDLKRR